MYGPRTDFAGQNYEPRSGDVGVVKQDVRLYIVRGIVSSVTNYAFNL